MSGVVVIPCWGRPEMLAVTLQHIKRAEGFDRQYYIFHLDEGFDQEIWRVIGDLFPPSILVVRRNKRRGEGNSSNILAGLDVAHRRASPSDLIYLIESDIWIARDFFTFHETVQKNFDAFAVSACHNQNNVRPTASYFGLQSAPNYQSLGVSFKRERVTEILVHNNDEYFKDMAAYCRTLFPASGLGELFTEQDGLIWRMIEAASSRTIYPEAPRAFHAGYYGYHRPGEPPTGTLSEKVAQLESMTDEEMNRRSQYKDIRRPNLDGYPMVDFVLNG